MNSDDAKGTTTLDDYTIIDVPGLDDTYYQRKLQ